ncbi:MAG: glycosyltransferase [Chloroflexota bacterium]
MRIAVISVHGCPLLTAGAREAGGMNVYIATLSRELGARGIGVDVFSRWHDPEVPEIENLAPNVRVIHLEASGRQFLSKDEIYPHLAQFEAGVLAFERSEGRGYDLIHSHYWLSGLVGLGLQRDWQTPHVAMFHTLGAVKNQARAGEHESDLRIQSEQQIIRQADAVVVASPQEEARLKRLYDHAQGKVRVIPCGVDTDTFRPLEMAEARRHLGLNGERILLFVGRPDPLKGLEILIGAASLLEHPKGVRVLVVGGEGDQSDSAYQPIHALAQTLDIAEQVSFTGAVSQQQLPYYYSAADVCVVPSYYESFGLVALEAMACGTPVVASRVGGLQTTVRDGETGFLIPWHCPEPFAERLDLLLVNETLRQSLGEAAHTAAQAYRWPAVADSVLELCEELTTIPAAPFHTYEV